MIKSSEKKIRQEWEFHGNRIGMRTATDNALWFSSASKYFLTLIYKIEEACLQVRPHSIDKNITVDTLYGCFFVLEINKKNVRCRLFSDPFIAELILSDFLYPNKIEVPYQNTNDRNRKGSKITRQAGTNRTKISKSFQTWFFEREKLTLTKGAFPWWGRSGVSPSVSDLTFPSFPLIFSLIAAGWLLHFSSFSFFL